MKITDSAYLAKSINVNSQLFFDTIGIFLKNHETLKRSNSELEAANRQDESSGKVTQCNTDKDTSQQFLSLLAGLMQLAAQKSILMEDGEVYSRLREDYYA